jgi:hypothetical protein
VTICLECGEVFYSAVALQYHHLFACKNAPSTLAGGDDFMSRRGWMGAPVDPEIIARVCHEAHRALQVELGEEAISPPWDDAPEWLRNGTLLGVNEALNGAGPGELHEAWCGQRFADGWTYGPVKDERAKTHPLLRDYDLLPSEQRAKDELFAAIVSALR